MESTNPWALLRAGKAEQEQGLRLVQHAYAREPDASHSMELGVALLWLGHNAEAWEHFRSIIDKAPNSGDNDYGMAGVAKWCLGEPGEAASQWRAGLKAKYARASGLGVRMPLLLFFASVVRPDISGEVLAKKLMLEKTKDRRIKTWPGPIAKLVLGQIDEREFQNHCRGANRQDTRDRQWLAEFYRSLIRYNRGEPSLFKEAMRKLTDTSQPEWSNDAVLLGRIWGEEFFLARHEAT